MRIILFYHSLLSCWNHGNAHFLRGICSELLRRGHDVNVYEPENAWSLQNLLRECGESALEEFHAHYPGLHSHAYDPETVCLDKILSGADLVIAHEWNTPGLIAALGRKRRESRSFHLLFHDTHHRAVTAEAEMAKYDLSEYDGVLAFGEILRTLYLERGWTGQAWTWHEAADTRLFRPLPEREKENDLVWIGNWGDDERTAELYEFLIEPATSLRLSTEIYGVRYPAPVRESLRQAGIRYRGWLPNFKAPEIYAKSRFTIHVPRQPYARAMPGIPTIRPFEALACGIPLVSAPWEDAEGLFTPGIDYLVAADGKEMREALADLEGNPDLAESVAAHGRRTILERHTCAHRVDELLAIYESLNTPSPRSGCGMETAFAGRARAAIPL